MMERQPPAAYIGALKAMAERPDSTPLLLEINYPVVVIHGDADMLIPVDRAREVKAALQKVNFIELSNVGHMPMVEAAQETANALKLLL
jgi:pimeloyl-ACP methyl ester carboxylesterase